MEKAIQIILVLSIYMLFYLFISIFKRKDETSEKGSTGLGTILDVIWRFIYLTTLIFGIIMFTYIFMCSL